jgi:hypothetical protein
MSSRYLVFGKDCAKLGRLHCPFSGWASCVASAAYGSVIFSLLLLLLVLFDGCQLAAIVGVGARVGIETLYAGKGQD